MAKQKVRFIEGALGKKLTKEKSEEIFDLMAELAKYGFK